MKLFGFTGGIGMGKSTSARFLSKKGFCVIDTDDLARDLVQPGQPALVEIKKSFGGEVVDSMGHLKRDVLASKVFSDATKRRDLEIILHPRIRDLWKTQVARWRDERQSIGVVIIPLLFETAAESDFDAVVCVACSPQTQQKRLRERNWSDEQIQQRIASQWSVEEKIRQSNFLIWTDVTLETHEAQLGEVLAG